MTLDPDPARRTVGCPTADVLAEYIDGVLPMAARERLDAHLGECDDCRAVCAETSAFLHEGKDAAGAVRPTSGRGRGFVIATMGMAAIVAGIAVFHPGWLRGPGKGDARPIAPLVAAFANERTRPLQGRLSGGFAYGPPPPVSRGASARPWRTETEMALAQLSDLPGGAVADEHAAAVAALIAGRLDDGIAALAALTARPDADAQVFSDLSAAYIERARLGTHPGDWQAAVDAADGALTKAPRMKEALFNRALGLDGLSDPAHARQAWEAYRREDPSGPWSEEAASHTGDRPRQSASAPRLVFRSIAEVASRPPVAQPEFQPWINLGKESTEYPASFRAALEPEPCSATLVGPSTILTAGHCLNDAREPIVLAIGSKDYSGVCDRAPGYHERDDVPFQDWALCKMNSRMPVAAETVNTDPAVVRRGRPVLITGFGCDYRTGVKEMGDVFRTGVVRVSDVSVDGTDLIRARSTAGVTLCPGDSGGGTFTLARGGSGRVQVAVNSSTDLKHVSFMSSLASKPAQRFLLQWSQCRGTKICGVDVDAESCRLAKIPRHNVKRYLVDDPCPVAWQ